MPETDIRLNQCCCGGIAMIKKNWYDNKYEAECTDCGKRSDRLACYNTCIINWNLKNFTLKKEGQDDKS